MTDQTPVQTPDQTPVLGAEIDADASSTDPEVETPGNHPNAEAAKYRVRAREAEIALANAQARIETLLRADIERVAGESLAMAGDFWIHGNDVNSYLIDGSLVDAERVREDAALLIAERPGLSKNRPAIDPTQGLGGNPPKAAEPTFSDLFK
jgi:hypothetical protein